MNNTEIGPIQGFILAGGSSRRMGKPKHQLQISGLTFVERAAAALESTITGPINIVGEIDERFLGVYFPDGNGPFFRKISDISIGAEYDNSNAARGALIGLYTALTKAKSEWIAVLACDLPLVSGELISRLAEYCFDEVDAVVPVQPDGRCQPLCAFYRCERSIPILQQLVSDGALRVQGFVSRLNTRFVEFAEIADLEGSANFFLNVDRPEDYETAVRIALDSPLHHNG